MAIEKSLKDILLRAPKKVYLMGKLLKAVAIFLTTFLLILTPIASTMKLKAQQEERYFFTLHLMVPKGNVIRQNVGEVLVSEFAKIGINLELHIVDFSEFLDRIRGAPKTWEEGGYDLFLVQTGYGFDPSGIRTFFHSEGGLQIFNFSNGILDKLIDEGDKTIDPEEREKIYLKASEILYYELPVIPYWRVVNTFLLSADVKGFSPYYDTDGCDKWEIPGKDAIRYVQPTDADNLNPIFMQTGYSFRAVGGPVYDSLVRYGENFQLEPHMAKSWEWVNDTYIVFYLHENIRWHDGVPFTAEDVKFTYETIMNKEVGAVDYSRFSQVIERVDVIDDYTIGIALKEPYAAFLDYIATHQIIPKHILEDVPPADLINHWTNTGEGGKFPIGTGPYKMVEWKVDEYIKLVVNEDYFMGPPKTKEIYMMVIPESATALAALQKGDVDILNDWFGWTPEQINEVKENPELTIASYPIPGPQLVGINCGHPILNNKNVRWAINYIIPRKKIIEELCGGVAGREAYQYLAPETLGHNPNLPKIEYSVEKAKEFMELAGYDYDWLEPPPPPPAITSTGMALAAVCLVVGIALGFGIGRMGRR